MFEKNALQIKVFKLYKIGVWTEITNKTAYTDYDAVDYLCSVYIPTLS